MIDEKEKENEKCEVDMKGTVTKIFATPEPEVSQEEAIKNFGTSNKKNSSDDGDDSFEDEEHLKRVKQELLASLKRVSELEKKVFNVNDKDTTEKTNKGKEKTKVVEKNKGKTQIQYRKQENTYNEPKDVKGQENSGDERE